MTTTQTPPESAQSRATEAAAPAPEPPEVAQPASKPVENELRCTICGLSACWTK